MHPERLGPWRIERRVGAGGMGNVYLGVHETTGERAAVKVLPAAMAREEGFEQRFSREIAALRKLSHRHIVRLFEDGVSDDGLLYYAMEFVDGVTLTADIQSRRRLPWREVIERSRQLASALKAAHDAGIVHRDLKPGNLMVGPDGQLKLTDFGVASLFASERLTRTGGIVGTADYMSPEQSRGQRCTARSDLYALGAVMYTMLTGRPPFTGETTAELLRKQQYGQFDLPSRYAPDMPMNLEELVCQLLEKDPSRRPPDALVVLRRLEQVLAKAEFAERQGESETVVRPAGGEAGAADEGAGTATTVRNLLRAEQAGRRAEGLSAILDNIWVLLCLLVLLIGFGIWMSRGRTESDVAVRLAEAERVLGGTAGPAWLRVREEQLRPLQERAARGEVGIDSARVRELQQRVEDYEFAKSLEQLSGDGLWSGESGESGSGNEVDRGGSSADSLREVDAEVRRLIRRAFMLRQSGDRVKARLELTAVLGILERLRSGSYLHRFVEEAVANWQTEVDGRGAELLLRELLRQWLAAGTESERQSLSATLRGALQLYGDRAELVSVVSEIEAALQRPAEGTADR